MNVNPSVAAGPEAHLLSAVFVVAHRYPWRPCGRSQRMNAGTAHVIQPGRTTTDD